MSSSKSTSEELPKVRQWYRHKVNGERGYLVNDGGRSAIRVDRPDDETLRPFDPVSWMPDTELQPFTDVTIAMVAHYADRGLCRALGLYKEARQDWDLMRTEDKASWIRKSNRLAPKLREELRANIYRLCHTFRRTGEPE